MAIEFPNTGSFSFSNLSFGTVQMTPNIPAEFDYVTVLFGISGLPVTGPAVSITNVRLSGPGLTGTKDIPPADPEFPLFLFRNIISPTSTSRYEGSDTALDTNIPVWNSSTNLVSFDIEILTPLRPGARIYYGLQYWAGGGAYGTTTFGNVNLIAAVPQATFGLPPDVVALITSRFGSVANFLRLRNQGYV